MKTRIYKVNDRLVRATNKSQAVNHVAKATIAASVASQDELIDALSEGVTVETAGRIGADEEESE